VLVPLTAAWLSLHVLATSGIVIMAFASRGSSDIVCTCLHGADHADCPMHGSSKDSTRCRLQRAQDELGIALISALSPLVMPTTFDVASLDAASQDLIPSSSPLPSDWLVPPEPPPPRG
jgi:hypothetical protein